MKENKLPQPSQARIATAGGKDNQNDDDDDEDDDDDITNFSTLFGKLGAVLSIMLSVLPKGDEFALQSSFFALLKLNRQIKDAKLTTRDDTYASCGRKATLKDMEGLQEYMEYADWAYNEDPSGKPLKDLLEEKGLCLLKHDTTTVPGYLGHYVAIPKDKKNKFALIGVKGTSGLEDLITDMCGAAVAVELERPYRQYADDTTSATAFRAHEGILIGTRRLATDLQRFVENLLLPQGYQIIICGHSLGAASAALLAVLLRSQIPELQKYDTPEGASNRLMQAYAFASPPILDLQNALDTAPFITTVVNNCDIITRCNIAPLAATVDVLKMMNEKLVETTNDPRKKMKSWAFWNKKEKDDYSKQEKHESDAKLLQDADELSKAVTKATKAVLMDANEDHLYVPGKVVLMYDEWGKKKGDMGMDSGSSSTDDVESAFPECAADSAVICDGTAKALQYIEFDGRMLDNHMTKDYKDSLRSVLISMKNSSAEAAP
jgi:hypothetical protein